VRFTIDPWDPAYGSSAEPGAGAGPLGLTPTETDVNLDVETPAARWAAVPAPARLTRAAVTAAPVIFVDGVRRVEARGWIERSVADADALADQPLAEPALFASYAAGAVRRGVWSPSPEVADVATTVGVFRAGAAVDGTPERLTLALQDAMGAVEVAVAERARRSGGDEAPGGSGEEILVVVDGPLRGRQHLPNAVGLIKTHHVSYLPPACERIVADLGAGERTPVFAMRSSWSRHSWYLRLPGPVSGPFSGIVRCEAPADLAPAAVVGLADRTSALLPRYASVPHKDSRAPQNLFPIAGLERALRHRLGDPAIVYRSLRNAAVVPIEEGVETPRTPVQGPGSITRAL
jgi:hypothetical protein